MAESVSKELNNLAKGDDAEWEVFFIHLKQISIWRYIIWLINIYLLL